MAAGIGLIVLGVLPRRFPFLITFGGLVFLIGVVRLVRGIRRWRTYRREAALVPPAEP